MPAKRLAFLLREQACKPGSVIDGHLSGTHVAARLKPPPRDGRAGLLSLHGVAPDRVYSTELSPADGRALISAFPPSPGRCPAVYLCCTCPRVAPGGCYPLSLPYGARTFLTHRLSPYARGRPARSMKYFNLSAGLSQVPARAFSPALPAACGRALSAYRPAVPPRLCLPARLPACRAQAGPARPRAVPA